MFYATLILLGIITFLLGALHWYQTRSRFAILFNQFPALPCTPLIGHISQFSSNPEKLCPQLRNLKSKFDRTFATWSAHYGGVHIITADDAEIILSNPKYTEKGIIYRFMKPAIGNGLLTSDVKTWQHRRKILSPALNFNMLRKFVEIFEEHSGRLVNKLRNECKNKEINIVPFIKCEALSSICETAMGTKLDMTDKKHVQYLDSINNVIETILRRFLNPLYFAYPIFAWSPAGLIQRRYIKIMKNFTRSIIKKREESFKDSDLANLNNNNDEEEIGIKIKRLAMLDLMIYAKKNSGLIDFEGICEEVDTFMAAGHETSAVATCMTLMFLAHYEDVQEKVIKELDEIFGGEDRPASYEDLMKMKYLELCIKESLRLFPMGPVITRNAPEEIKLTHNTVPKGCEILIHIYDIHRNEKYFPNPDKFDPDRFLPENSKGRHPYAFIPFSAGLRNCIGQKFALLEMKSIISKILRNFTMKPVTTFEELRWTALFLLQINGPLNITFIPRK